MPKQKKRKSGDDVCNHWSAIKIKNPDNPKTLEENEKMNKKGRRSLHRQPDIFESKKTMCKKKSVVLFVLSCHIVITHFHGLLLFL